jgi:hypothetical protein
LADSGEPGTGATALGIGLDGKPIAHKENELEAPTFLGVHINGKHLQFRR